MDKALTCVFFIYFGVLIVAEDEFLNITNLCPFSDFCKTEAKYWLDPEYVSCCQKCSCAPDCYKMGTCCPDAQDNIENLPSQPTTQCLDLDTILNAPRGFSPDIGQQVSYIIIDHCPGVDGLVIYRGCNAPANLEDYVIVSDTKYEKNFKNRQCALCHGVQDVIEWDLIAECEKLMLQKFQSFKDRNEFILKNCQLNARPPNRQIDELSRCFWHNEVISTCPSFGQNEPDYDTQIIRNACLEPRSTQNTLVKDPKTQQIYSNIYCYLCNNPEQSEGPGICPIDEDDGTVMAANTVAFSAVIGEARDVSGEEERRCEQTEMWDSFAAVCRKLHCPIGTIPVDGVCKNSVLYAEGFTLFVLFEIVVFEGNSDVSTEMLNKIDSHLDRLLETNFGCGACQSQVFQYKSTIFYRLPMYTTRTCSISTLLENVRSLVTRNGNTTLVCKRNDGWDRFGLRYYADEMPPQVDIYHATAGYSKRCLVRPSQINMELLHDCPRFVMSIEEMFHRYTIGYTSSRERYLDPSGVVSVCTATYFQMSGLSYSGVMSLHLVNRTFWAGLLIYVQLSLKM